MRRSTASSRTLRSGFTLNHLFHFFRGEITVQTYLENLRPLFVGVEVRNAMMLPCQNELISKIVDDYEARALRFGSVAGSDAHILSRVGTTYTEAPGHSWKEFLANIWRGRPLGQDGSTVTLVTEIYGVILNYWGSLVGLRRNGLTRAERIAGIGFSLLSLPFQFAPLLVAVLHGAQESMRVAKWEQKWVETRPHVDHSRRCAS